jgi:hypothetical protein
MVPSLALFPLGRITLSLAVLVFAIEPCGSALAGLRAVTRKLDQTRFRHGWLRGSLIVHLRQPSLKHCAN